MAAAAGEIAIEALRRPLLTGGVDLAAIETRTFLGIAEQVIGG